MCGERMRPSMSQGRLRSFPQSGIRPGVYAGLGKMRQCSVVRPLFTGLLPGPAARTLVNGRDKGKSETTGVGDREPGVNAGPNTACRRKRP